MTFKVTETKEIENPTVEELITNEYYGKVYASAARAAKSKLSWHVVHASDEENDLQYKLQLITHVIDYCGGKYNDTEYWRLHSIETTRCAGREFLLLFKAHWVQ